MRNYFLLGLLSLSLLMPIFTFASSSDGWIEGHRVSSSQYLEKTCVGKDAIKKFSCDYTGDPVVLRMGYGVEFRDRFYAGNQDRWLWDFCAGIIEPSNNGNYNNGENPGFDRTDEVNDAGGFVGKNTKPLIIKTIQDYQIRKHPEKRSSNNLMVKYVVEYANDDSDNPTRYQHTECYPYIISRCGDGVVDNDWNGRCDKNGNCKAAEACDPESPEWKNRSDGKTCSSTCTIIEPKDPVCSSSYNNKTEYTDSSDQWLKSTTDKLCDEGTVEGFSFSPKTGGPRTYTWNCKNGPKITKQSCKAYQEWCGDGVKNGEEDCDDGSKNGTSASSCSKICTTVGSAECGQENGSKRYFKNGKQTTPWLTEKSEKMCADGQTVGKPIMVGDHIEWTCSNKNGTERTCKAYQEWCGDEIKNGEEDCDGTDLCDFQCKTITPPKDCVDVFKGKLRLGKEHTFSDKFKAGGKDWYLYYGPNDVKFVENHGDYGDDPKFEWTSELTKQGNKVEANTEIVVMKSNPYKAIYKPTVRAWDNIYLEYTIWYSDVYKTPIPSKSNLYSSKECAYYEITRCGDGKLDEDYGEECDPGSEGTSVLPDGRICNSDCKIENSKKGTPKIEKTLKNKKVVKSKGEILTWEVKVTAEGGDVTDFEIQDLLPKVLDYVDYSEISNKDKLVISGPKGPVGSGNNNIYTWDVKGTLKAGNTLLIEVKTQVNSMPTAQDNYRNVACVIDDGNKDCKDDQPGMRRVEKKLLSPKEITKEGELVTWSLKLIVDGGEVKNPVIKDVLPPVLGYTKYEVIHNPGIKIHEPEESKVLTGGQYLDQIKWTTEGTIGEKDYVEIKLTTHVKTMPDKEYRNVLCGHPGDTPEDEECEPVPFGPKLWITKTFTDGTKKKTVKIGDEIGYRIEFGNNGNAPATITSIKDFLPKNVKYIKGEIHIDRASTHTTSKQEKEEELWEGFKVVDGVDIEIYGGMTLEPGDKGYIILTVQVLETNLNNRTNFACIYLNDEKIDCDSVIHEIPVSCKPTFSPATFADVCASDTSTFSTTVTCQSTGEKADIKIICDGNVIMTGYAVQLTGTCSSNVNNTGHTVQCMINGSTKGENGEICEGSFRRNTKSCGSPSSCFIAGTKVLMADGTEKNIEDVEEGEYVMGESGPNKVKGFDRPTLGDRNLWKINGEGDYFVSDEHPFKTTDGWKSFNPAMTRQEIEYAKKEGYLKGELPIYGELKIGDILYTKTGTTKITSLEAEEGNPNTQLYNFMLDGDNTYYANGYLVHNKGGSSGGGSKSPSCDTIKIDSDGVTCSSKTTTAYFKLECDGKTYNSTNKARDHKFKECTNPKNAKCYVSDSKNSGWETNSTCTKITKGTQECFNVNAGNFSIEEGEIFPFYWNMSNMDYFYTDKNNYTEFNGDYKNAISNYENGGSCEEKQEGKIAKDSMVCTFNIYDGNKYHGGMMKDGRILDNPLYTIKGPCLSKTSLLSETSTVVKTNNLIDARYKAMIRQYCNNPADCEFYPEGGGKALPTAVYYIQNFGKDDVGVHLNVGTWEGDWSFEGTKGSASDKSLGEYKIELNNVEYLQCESGNRKKVNAQDDLDFGVCQNNFVLTNSYTVQKTPSGNVTASIDALKNYLFYDGGKNFVSLLNAIQSTEYQPNTKVDDAMKAFMDKYSKLAIKVNTDGKLLKGKDVTIKKVPGKNIYFIEGDIEINGGKNNIDTPFTIVQTKGKATINGDVEHNMMLLTKGNIIFNGNCTTQQKVKGIFYAGGNLIRSGIEKNKDTGKGVWCIQGGLYVQGVLIGNHFNELMNQSRSNLNDWFYAKNGTDAEILNKRKSYVMNGASVVIEYSPSVFTKSTMPPGAEDFTTALSIYKN